MSDMWITSSTEDQNPETVLHIFFTLEIYSVYVLYVHSLYKDSNLLQIAF